MGKQKIIVRPESSDLWWGIYGFCEKTGWEDIELFYENGERIGEVCLNGKAFMTCNLDELRKNPEEKEFLQAIERYAADDKCHYWYFYNQIGDEDFYEVPYDAPRNSEGIKPRFMDIWHPDDAIGLSTIESGVKAFAAAHLGIDDCEIEIQNVQEFGDSLKSFHEHRAFFGGKSPVQFGVADEVLEKLSSLWNLPKEKALKKFNDMMSDSTPSKGSVSDN